jgi:hypothetical protein
MTIKKEPLTFNELAVQYDRFHNGRRARTMPLEQVYKWAESRPDLFIMNKDTTLNYAEGVKP